MVPPMEQMAQKVLMAFWSDGGQGNARRNAWSAMAADAKRARQRTEAASFLVAAGAVRDNSAPAVVAAHA
jgi:hypothetical protein